MEGRSDADKMGCRRPATSTISRGLFNDLLKDLGPAKRKSDTVTIEIQGGPRNVPEIKLPKKRDSIGSSLANSISLSTSLHSLGSKLNLGRVAKQAAVSEGSASSGRKLASSLLSNRLTNTPYAFAQLEGSASSRSSNFSSLELEISNRDEQILEYPVGRKSDPPDKPVEDRLSPIGDIAQLDISSSAIGIAVNGDVCTKPTHQIGSMQRKGSSENLNRSIHSLDSTTLSERSTRRSASRGTRRPTKNLGECTATSDFSSSSTLRRDELPSDHSTRSCSRRHGASSSSLSQGSQVSTSPTARRSLSRNRGNSVNQNSNHISSSRRRRDGMSLSDCSTGSLSRSQHDSISRSSDNTSLSIRRQDGLSSSGCSTGSSSRKPCDSISKNSDHFSLPRRRLALSNSTTNLGSRASLGQDGIPSQGAGNCRSSQSINSLMISRHQKKSSSATRERPLLQRSSSDDSRLPLLKMSLSTAQRPSLERSSSNASLKPPLLQRSSSHGQRPLLQRSSSQSSKRLLLQMSISTAGQRPSLERSLSNASLKPTSLQRSSSHSSQRSLLQRSSTHSSQRSLLQRSSTHSSQRSLLQRSSNHSSKRSLLQRSSSNLNQRPLMQKSSSNTSLKPLIDLLEQGSKQYADPMDSGDNESWCTEASHDISIKSQSGDVIFQSLPDLQSLLSSDLSTSNGNEGGTIEANFNVLANASWDYGVLERNVNGCRYPRGAASTPPLIVLTDRQKHIMTSLIELEKGISVEYKSNS